MAGGELKGKVVRGFAWNVGERVASALFGAWVVINVTNRLQPFETAPIAILAAFVAIFNSFVDSGFSQALIRKQAPTGADFSSAFWFNAGMAMVVYGLLMALSHPTAQILKMPEIVHLAPVFFLVVPVAALGIIQQTILTREFDFRTLSVITFAATVVSGVLAVVLAVNGFGVWALVAQRVTQTSVRSLLLWILGRFRPALQFSTEAIRRMFAYSSRLLGTDLLNNIYNSLPQFIIGHIHAGTLGNYDTARKVRDLPVVSAMNAMQSVTFPALARLEGDEKKFAGSVSRVVGSIVFLMFPMMAGLIVVSADFFGVFLAPQWQGAVPFFRVLCLAGFATPLATISANILRTRSDGKAVLRAEIIKKVFATVILAVTIPFGPMAIAWGVVGIAFADAFVSFATARRLSAYGLRALARDVLPVLALTAVMVAGAWGVGLLAAALPIPIILTLKILTGIFIYTSGAAIFRFPALAELSGFLKKYIR